MGCPQVTWARTIDGAQGGTWRVAHLLGTPALDQYRGYVGQSRSQHPTHTWNTTPAPVIDHGGVPADQREPGEHVLAALTRTPDTSLAARSDPYALDRRLRALIAAHRGVLAHRPPDPTIRLIRAEAALRQARQDHADAARQVARANGRRDDLNTLGVLSSHGRAQRRNLAGEVARAEKQVSSAGTALADAEAAFARAKEAQADRDAFNGSEGWRDAELARLHHQLDAQWADVAITCAQNDDPLAYGTDVLRNARFHLSHRLEILEQRIPPDRSREWRLARRDLGTAINDRDQAQRVIADARQRLDAASGTRWRSKPDESAAAQADFEAALRRLRALPPARSGSSRSSKSSQSTRRPVSVSLPPRALNAMTSPPTERYWLTPSGAPLPAASSPSPLIHPII